MRTIQELDIDQINLDSLRDEGASQTPSIDHLRPCVEPNSTFDRTTTDMMERLPTELMVEVVGYSDKPTIHTFTIVSSKYREIAQPHLFRHISINAMMTERNANFVEQVESSSKHASMIKILTIRMPFTPELLQHLFAVVSNLEELFMYIERADFSLSPHYFPHLRRVHFRASRRGVIDDVVANFIPCHRVLDDLNVSSPQLSTSDPATLCIPPLMESVSSGVNRLVTYQGPRGLLPLLTPNSKMKHLTVSQKLDERTLRKLSSAVSGGLLSLIVNYQTDPFKYEALPGPLIPSLFPTLRSIAWLSLDIQSISVVDQLPHLRRVWFSSTHAWPKAVEGFITKILELSDKKTRPLQEIRVYAANERPFSYTYSKECINSPWVLSTNLPIVPFVE